MERDASRVDDRSLPPGKVIPLSERRASIPTLPLSPLGTYGYDLEARKRQLFGSDTDVSSRCAVSVAVRSPNEAIHPTLINQNYLPIADGTFGPSHAYKSTNQDRGNPGATKFISCSEETRERSGQPADETARRSDMVPLDDHSSSPEASTIDQYPQCEKKVRRATQV